MHLNHKYRTRLVSSSALAGSNGSRMLILTMKRPTLFRFKPGQYAYLRISKISNQWHPFSIASDPSSPTLQFYVEVCGKTSWTANIWEMLKEDRDCKTSNRQIIVEIMGPAGTPLAKTDDYSHVLAIGSGTGIVPILSLFKQQVHQLLRLDPETHFRDLKIYLNKVEEVEFAKRSRKGSVAGLLYRSFFHQKSYLHLKEEKGEFVKESILKTMSRCNEGDELSRQEYRSTVAQMKKAAFQATRSIYGTVFLGILPATGVSLIGLMVSWSTGSFELSSGMVKFVKVFTAVFQACFAVFPFFILDATKFLTSIDIVMTIIAPFADWYWWQKSQGNHALDAGQLTLYCLLMGYMVMRLWSIALVPRNRSWRIRAEDKEVRTLERFDMVWVARSASMVSEILIDINEVWKALVDSWGEKNAAAVCRISVYVTDKDIKARKQLKDRLRDTLFIKSGSIHFGRPNFSALIQANTIELIATRRRSQNLLAYVGSPQLAQEIHHHKISNDIVTAITGNEKHQMEFVSESYGGVKATTENIGVEDAVPNEIVKTSTAKSLQSEFEEHDALSIRMTTSYDDSFDVGSKV